MKAVIAYGSGAGGTKQIARAICEGMRGTGVDAAAVSIEYLTPERIREADLFSVGSPVHFYRETHYVMDFLGRLPSLEGKRAFLFCTCGMERIGETLRRLYDAVCDRGASVVGAEKFSSAMSYHPLRSRRLGNSLDLPDETVTEAARRFGERMADPKALAPIPPPPVSTITEMKARLLADKRVRRTFFPGVRINPALCTDYGSCLSRCAVEGIGRKTGSPIPHVTDKCVQCLECIGWCPRAAIEPDSRIKEWLSTVWTRLGIH